MWNISEHIMLIRQSGEPIVRDILRSDWVFILLIFPVLIYLVVSLVEKYSLSRIVKIVFNNKFAYKTYRNISHGVQFFQMMLGILSLISISTFILFAELHFDIIFFGLPPFQLWLFNLVMISAAIGLRYLVNLAAGSLSRTGDLFSEYFFSISRSYKLMGIVLMIMNFFISYLVSIPDSYLIFLSFSIIAIIMFFRLIRLVYLFLKRRFSLFYMILYLCALEILPALILLKYLGGQDN